MAVPSRFRTAEANDPIESLIGALGARLRGPRRVKTDLLAEARDGLTDAADAYAEAGHDRAEARRHAAADFGTPDEVAPAYQDELALSQGRRTVLRLLFVQVAVFAWGELSWRLFDLWGDQRPDADYLFIAQLVDVFNWVILGLAVLLLVAFGRGLRRLSAARRLTAVTGLYTFVALGGTLVAAPLMTFLTPGLAVAVSTSAWAATAGVVQLAAPTLYLGRHACRCLTTAR